MFCLVAKFHRSELVRDAQLYREVRLKSRINSFAIDSRKNVHPGFDAIFYLDKNAFICMCS